jgi:hypothetical protein
MRQLFFISPKGFMPVRQAMTPKIGGTGTHGWCDTEAGDDPHKDSIIGVVEMHGDADAEQVIDRLEAQGIMWLPNHLNNEQIKAEHAAALARHGVLPTHTTAQAMEILHGKSGFPPLKPNTKRF